MWIFFLLAAAGAVYILTKKDEDAGAGGPREGTGGGGGAGTRPSCPTTAEIDKVISDLWAGKVSPTTVEAMAKQLTTNLCPASAAKLRDAIKAKAASSFTADPGGLGSIDLGLGGATPTFGITPSTVDSAASPWAPTSSPEAPSLGGSSTEPASFEGDVAAFKEPAGWTHVKNLAEPYRTTVLRAVVNVNYGEVFRPDEKAPSYFCRGDGAGCSYAELAKQIMMLRAIPVGTIPEIPRLYAINELEQAADILKAYGK